MCVCVNRLLKVSMESIDFRFMHIKRLAFLNWWICTLLMLVLNSCRASRFCFLFLLMRMHAHVRVRMIVCIVFRPPFVYSIHLPAHELNISLVRLCTNALEIFRVLSVHWSPQFELFRSLLISHFVPLTRSTELLMSVCMCVYVPFIEFSDIGKLQIFHEKYITWFAYIYTNTPHHRLLHTKIEGAGNCIHVLFVLNKFSELLLLLGFILGSLLMLSLLLRFTFRATLSHSLFPNS